MASLRDVLRPVVGLLVGVVIAEALAQGVLAIPSLRDKVRAAAWPVVAPLDWRDDVRRDFGEEGRLHRFDARLGWALRPGARVETGLAVATVDDAGHRLTPAAAPGARPVLLLGDSFTFGWDVEDDQALAARLGALRPDLAPTNLGVPGYGLDQVVLAWRARPHGDHAVVVVGLIDLLVTRTVEPFAIYVRPNLAAEQGRFDPDPVPEPDALRWRLRLQPALLTLLRANRWATARAAGQIDALAHARSRALLARFAEEVAAAGDTLVVLPMPVAPDGTAARLRPAVAALDDVTAPTCARPGVICPDPVAGLEAVARAGPLLARGHYSAAALDALAHTLADAIPPATP